MTKIDGTDAAAVAAADGGVGSDRELDGSRPTGSSEESVRLRRLVDEHAALGRVATLVARDTPPEQVFQTVTEEVCRLLGIGAAVMQRFDDERTTTIVGLYGEQETPIVALGDVQRLEEGQSALQVLRTGAPARADDYDKIEGEAAQAVQVLGFRSTVAVPIIAGGVTWGALIVGLREGETLPAETEQRMLTIVEPVALALAGVDAREKLHASRARLVEASDAARHRLQRNLHDGAQQRLVSLALLLRLAQDQLDDDHAVAPLLQEADETLGAALQELRELANGLHPAVLVERGLVPALKGLATRAPFPVRVTPSAPQQRMPPPIEATAYYVASEALANAAKHADPSSVTLSVRATDGRAVVEIIDDGCGGASADGGTGLLGLTDRVEALGGRLAIDSPPGRGTTIRAELPLRRATAEA